ncbi:MAG TPA: hypothetical protein VM187_06530, partial [Niastella sp.]|nr:hypothetical protein [Niastella sp.]
SYGSRCVKPPVIVGDVSRPKDMTVRWSSFAQAQTTRLMKGMLTGPVTILQWSFVRDDQPRSVTTNQIALAINLLPAGNIWVNPDCGLKTRNWPETKKALENMVKAAATARAALVDITV